MLGVMLPEFTAIGEGRFEMNTATRDVRLAGRFAGDVNQLEIIDPRLRELGRLSTATTFDLEYGGDHVRVSELVVSISGRKVSTITASSFVSFMPMLRSAAPGCGPWGIPFGCRVIFPCCMLFRLMKSPST